MSPVPITHAALCK
jgi:hypothetical protein